MCDFRGWTYITFTLTNDLSVLNIRFLKIKRNILMPGGSIHQSSIQINICSRKSCNIKLVLMIKKFLDKWFSQNRWKCVKFKWAMLHHFQKIVIVNTKYPIVTFMNIFFKKINYWKKTWKMQADNWKITTKTWNNCNVKFVVMSRQSVAMICF
jgi:hypothetical protein